MLMGCVGTAMVVRYVLGVVERTRGEVINGDDRIVNGVDETCEHVDP